MLSGSVDMLDEKGREFLGFTGCHTLGRDGVGEGDDVSSVGRILLIVNVMYCNCLCV